MRNCTTLAASLTRAFLEPLAWDEHVSNLGKSFSFSIPSSNQDVSLPLLSDYLAKHGILLSMCELWMGASCVINPAATHVAASWVHQEIGFNVIPTSSFGHEDDGENVPIGLILDPTVTNVSCMYPTDGATDGRDEDGCGPMMDDSQYGSKGARHSNYFFKQWYKRGLITYKDFNFGVQTNWMDIDCMDFLMTPMNWGTLWDMAAMKHVLANNSSGVQNWTQLDEDYANENTLSEEHAFGTWLSRAVENVVAFAEHPVCRWFDPKDKEPQLEDSAFIFTGNQSWPPSLQALADVVQQQTQFMESYPRMMIWNEFVIPKPRVAMADIVQAVFIISSRPHKSIYQLASTRRAIRTAKYWNIPLLQIELYKTKKLDKKDQISIRCIQEAENQQLPPDHGNTNRAPASSSHFTNAEDTVSHWTPTLGHIPSIFQDLPKMRRMIN